MSSIKNDKGSSIEHQEHYSEAPVDLANNVNAKIKNPLKGIPKDKLFAQVTDFCNTNGFSDRVPLFQKAALAAQNPAGFETIEEFDEQDRYHLRREITHKWSLPMALYYTIFITSLGSAIQGWDNTGANGANLSFPVEFGIEQNTWLVGCINAAPTILGLMSAWLSDPMNNYIGRRGTIFVTGLFCVFPVLGQAFTRNWWELLICRMLLGVGIGIKITTIPIFSSETVPAIIRGGLVMTFQLWVAFGIFIGFCSNLVFYRIGRHAWRFQLAAAFAPAVPLLILVWFCPESPRWLLKKKRFEKSFKSFCRLRNSELQAARDLYYAYTQLVEEDIAFGNSTFFGRIRDLFVIPRLQRATLGSMVVMLAQQFSGINIMAFYSATIFAEAGYNTRTALLISLGFGAVNFTFAFPAIWTIDTFGRRNLLLFTFPNMAWALFLVAGCFQLSVDNAARLPLIATFVFVFTAFYSPGIGPVPNVYAAECFPLSHRETGVAWSIFVNNTVSTILGLTFPSMLAGMGPTGAFCFYGGLNLVAFVMIFFWLPETKQRTLEELDFIFAVPTRRHMSYQMRTWAPWFVRRYILWQRDAHLEPLYQLDGVLGDGEGTKVDHFH
ncbi:hypothetical protein C8R43DRAFT_1128727 [Mycena crocata]|nr:hypothetical protein C8R43DRAFT_1128727 [Mycena crocata]